jgi:glycosyltransferase involved in cell wall biosynthesis
VPERDLLIADDAQAFAAQIGRLLDDPGLATRLGTAARHVMEKDYGWGASVERLSAFYGEVIEARGTA